MGSTYGDESIQQPYSNNNNNNNNDDDDKNSLIKII